MTQNLITMVALFLGLTCLEDIGSCAGVLGQNQFDSHATIRIGMMNYSKSDGNETKAGTASALNYEYSRFTRLSQGLVLGFRQATDPESQRDAYHAAYAGYRLFPFGIGFPVTAMSGEASLTLDSLLKPYAESSLGLGRMLMSSNSGGAAEFAADTLSISFGGGIMAHFFTRWAVDFHVLYEMVQARGGTSEGLAATGTNIYILMGSGLLF
ncbi:MAG: hypothetical protein NTV34_06190 [Proteobacteria bacterium]|nr:hypothetical protein [Pseudomonadota bacterium]